MSEREGGGEIERERGKKERYIMRERERKCE